MSYKFAGKLDVAVKKATGKSWDEWFSILDKAKASELPHKDIVLMILDKGFITSPWWAQSVVVGYEEKIGRRVFGKREVGDFSVSIGKTLDGSTDDALKMWEKLVKGKNEFNKVKVEGDIRVTKPNNNWRYWKADLSDGSKLSVNIGPKGDNQATLSVTLDKLKDKKTVEKWRKYWKEALKDL